MARMGQVHLDLSAVEADHKEGTLLLLPLSDC